MYTNNFTNMACLSVDNAPCLYGLNECLNLHHVFIAGDV